MAHSESNILPEYKTLVLGEVTSSSGVATGASHNSTVLNSAETIVDTKSSGRTSFNKEAKSTEDTRPDHLVENIFLDHVPKSHPFTDGEIVRDTVKCRKILFEVTTKENGSDSGTASGGKTSSTFHTNQRRRNTIVENSHKSTEECISGDTHTGAAGFARSGKLIPTCNPTEMSATLNTLSVHTKERVRDESF